MTANATHPGRVCIPGTDIGVKGTLVAEPQTENMLLALDDRLALGPVKVDTNPSGTLETPGLVVPIVSGVLWLLRFEPHRHDVPPFTLGVYNLNTSGVDLKDLVVVEVTGITETDRLNIAGALALGATNDTATASFFNNPASATVAAASSGLKGKFAYPSYYDAESYKTGSLTDLQAIQAACAAATAAGRGATVRLSSRVWDVGNGLSMSGYSCGLVGMGASWTSGAGTPAGTVLYGSSQTGAVLDMGGWLPPGSFRGSVEFGKFAIRGSNVADATKAKAGLKNSGAALACMWWHDMVIAETGGPCIDFKDFYLSTMDRVVCTTPVSAQANDVPYAIFRANNGSTFNSLGFRSMLSSNDTGVSGALVITDDGTDAGSNGKWNSTWFEFLHMPNGGALIDCAANTQQFQGTYFTDIGLDAGATNTYYVKLRPSAFSAAIGGCIWRGQVPGAGTVSTGGIRVSQNNNRIEGSKGFNGNNVVLDSGVTGTFVSLGGAISGTPGTAGWTDNSGNSSNTLLDYFNYPNSGTASGAAGGVGTIIEKYKTADTTRPDTDALAADPHLVFPGLVAGAVYSIEGFIAHTTPTANDLEIQWTGLTGGPVYVWSSDGGLVAQAAASTVTPNRAVTASGAVDVGGSGTKISFMPIGSVTVGTAGTLSFSWHIKTAGAGNATLHAGSWIRLRRMA